MLRANCLRVKRPRKAAKSRMRTSLKTANRVGIAMNQVAVINDVIAMTAANVRMTAANVRMSVASVRMTVVSVRMTVVSVRMTVVSVRMTVASVRMTAASVRAEMVSLKIRAALQVGSRIRKKRARAVGRIKRSVLARKTLQSNLVNCSNLKC